ncbi:head protein [Archangium gephyra]|nr:head protein [Archangium gephyra]
MIIEYFPGDAMPLLGRCQEDSPSEGERELLDVANGAVAFVYFTGQLYRFDEFRTSRPSGHPPAPSFVQVLELLERIRRESSSAEEKEILLAVMDVLSFIESSGQKKGLEEYLRYWEADTLPPVIAAFKTDSEAETWLDEQPVPPYGARVLIGNQYHSVKRSRERREPGFLPIPTLEEFIGSHLEEGLPPAVAAFDTQADAESWLANTPPSTRHAFITIGGKPHLAVCQENVKHRALYPLMRAEQ